MQNNSRIPIEEPGHSLDTGLSMVYQDDLKRATPIQTPACIPGQKYKPKKVDFKLGKRRFKFNSVIILQDGSIIGFVQEDANGYVWDVIDKTNLETHSYIYLIKNNKVYRCACLEDCEPVEMSIYVRDGWLVWSTYMRSEEYPYAWFATKLSDLHNLENFRHDPFSEITDY